MRGFLSRVGGRVGIAVTLLLLIGGVVAIAKLAGQNPRQAVHPSVQPPTSTIDSTSGDDAEVAITPTTYGDESGVRNVASDFVAAWLRRDLTATGWHARIKPLCTTPLAESLDGVDPLSVPATRMTGEPLVTRRGDLFAVVSVKVDTGTVLLNEVKQGDAWLVDGVDWDRT